MSECKNSNYVPELFETLADCVKEANKLPTLSDFVYFNQFSEFSEIMDTNQALVSGFFKSLAKIFALPLSTYADIEKASNFCLKNVDGILASLEQPLSLQQSLIFSLPKPQLSQTIDNSFNPFIPKLLYKYHAKVDMPQGILKAQQLRCLQSREDKIENIEKITHPYAYEIESFTYKQSQFLPLTSYFNDIDQESLNLVLDDQSFYKMIQELRLAEDIAVDLENHSIRSFQGLCCLMQISTRTKDFIIDPLALFSSMPVLGVIFADPSIVKVFHGSENDIEWLQRDFGLYIVNMFDTGLAAKELRYPSHSLAFLLKSFCDIDADKRYQLAD